MVDLDTEAERLLEGSGTSGQDHELLHLEAVAGVCTTVDDVERWDRHNELVSGLASQLSEVVVKRDSAAGSTSTCSGEGNSEDCISANLLLAPAPLVLGAVNLLDHLAVDGLLLSDVHALERRRQDVVYVRDSLEAALAKEALRVLVAELKRLVDASGGARGNGSAEDLAVAGEYVGLDGRVATRVNDLARTDRGDSGEGSGLETTGEASSGDVAEHLSFFVVQKFRL